MTHIDNLFLRDNQIVIRREKKLQKWIKIQKLEL